MSVIQRLGIICVVMLVMLLAGISIFFWNVGRSFHAKVQALKADGKPVSIDDLNELAAIRGGGTGVLTDLEKPVMSLEQAIMASGGESGDEAKHRELRNKVFRDFEKEQPDVIALLRSGADDPGFGSVIAPGSPPMQYLDALQKQLGLYRSAVRVLKYDADAELDDGSTDEAVLDAIAILKWAEKSSHEPGMTSHLMFIPVRSMGIQVAAECLYRGDASDDVRNQLLDVLIQHDRVAAWSRAIDSERAFMISMINDWPASFRVMQSISGDSVAHLESLERFEAVGKKRWGVDPGFKPTKPMANNSAATLHAALKANRRVQAQTNALLILAAWQEQGSDATATINDLSLPAETLIDPFDGAAMKLKMTTEGPIIYSVGDNGIDDGGDVAEGTDTDAGVGP